MNVNIEDFVGVFEDAFSKEYCDSVITYFEDCREAGCSYTRQQEKNGVLKTIKEDTMVWGDIHQSKNLVHPFNDIFWQCYDLYSDKYDALKNSGAHNNYAWKVQKTELGQGYHVWHYESDCADHSRRLLVWALYLNDVAEGGETEFLYQSKRVKPKAGTLVIWPASFTHVHRGNPPLSNTKYIVTGWVEF